MKQPKLSILIPSIPSRVGDLLALYAKLQIDVITLGVDVQILTLMDNRKMSIGAKRDALVQAASGEYLAFIDDDDTYFEEYLSSILPALESKPDVVTFKQLNTIDGKQFYVNFSLHHEYNEEAKIDKNGNYHDIERLPFHVCIWKSEIAKTERFKSVNYGEDWDWAKRLIPKCNTEVHINKVLHHYIFNSQTTEASTESNEVWQNPN